MELSRDLPVIVIAVDTQEKIDQIMPKIDEMMSGGMITMEPATVIRYARKHRQGHDILHRSTFFASRGGKTNTPYP